MCPPCAGRHAPRAVQWLRWPALPQRLSHNSRWSSADGHTYAAMPTSSIVPPAPAPLQAHDHSPTPADIAADSLPPAPAAAATATVHDARGASAAQPRSRWARLWRRVITNEDWLHIHAASSTLYYAYGLPRCCQIVYDMAAHHAYVTPYAPELWLLLATSVAKNASAVPMSIKHRKGVMREIFLIASLIDMLSVVLIFNFSGPAVGIVRPPVLAEMLTIVGAISAVPAVVLPAVRARATFAAQERSVAGSWRVKDAPRGAALRVVDAVKPLAVTAVYVIVQTVPALFLFQACVIATIGSEHTQAIYPRIADEAFCTLLFGTFIGNTGVFLATLRDRRLVPPRRAIVMQAAMFAAFMVWLAASLSGNDPQDAMLRHISVPSYLQELVQLHGWF